MFVHIFYSTTAICVPSGSSRFTRPAVPLRSGPSTSTDAAHSPAYRAMAAGTSCSYTTFFPRRPHGQGKQFVQNGRRIRAAKDIFILAHVHHAQRKAIFPRHFAAFSDQPGAVLLRRHASQHALVFAHCILISFQARSHAPRDLSWAVTVSISPIFQSGRGRLAS